MTAKIEKTDEQWRAELTPEQYEVMRQRGTEAPFKGIYTDTETAGTYRCAGCNAELFSSDTKFHSGSGWPSFYDVVDHDAVELHEDRAHGMVRTEVTCATCGAHLGHVFPDGPVTGQRFCINSCALELEPAAGA